MEQSLIIFNSCDELDDSLYRNDQVVARKFILWSQRILKFIDRVWSECSWWAAGNSRQAFTPLQHPWGVTLQHHLVDSIICKVLEALGLKNEPLDDVHLRQFQLFFAPNKEKQELSVIIRRRGSSLSLNVYQMMIELVFGGACGFPRQITGCCTSFCPSFPPRPPHLWCDGWHRFLSLCVDCQIPNFEYRIVPFPSSKIALKHSGY